jgi:hypothetical protein
MGISRLSSIKINKRGLNVFTPPTQTFSQLLSSIPPWAKYSGANYNNNTLPDDSGNGRHATCSGVYNSSTINNGGSPTIPLPICKGNANATIIFPVGSIPSGDYTIAFITRYAGSSNNRVLCGHAGQNFILGHHSAKGGVLYDGTKWDTAININTGSPINNITGSIPNWLSMCVVSNGTNVADNIIVNGVPKAVLSITPINTINQLGINTSSYLEKSSFELSQLLIFDRALTPIQVKVITDAFSNYLISGILQ